MRLLIADDQTLFRDMLKSLLVNESDISIVATVSNGLEAVNICRLEKIDIALLDIRMPEMDGVSASKKIFASSPETRVILLTAFEEIEMIEAATSENIYGFLLKDVKSDHLIQAVRMAEQGLYVANKSIQMHWLRQMLSCPPSLEENEPAVSSMAEFTPTDVQILQCLTAGMSNKEIAETISYSESTVKNRISKLLSDLDLKDRTQLALFALKHHLT
jgi:DNA-binding NarL/FixJ family response regulator